MDPVKAWCERCKGSRRILNEWPEGDKVIPCPDCSPQPDNPQGIEEKDCPFCDYAGPSKVLAEQVIDGCAVLIFEPLNPVAEGHLLAVPRSHAEDWLDAPWLAGMTMWAAAEYARATGMGDCNLITSKGEAATQTIRHLHLHLIPRAEGDGLPLPWSEVVPLSRLREVEEDWKEKWHMPIASELRRRGVRVDG